MTDTSAHVLMWETDVRVMTHPLMIGNFVKMMVLTGLIMGALMSGLMAITGAANAIVPLLELLGVVLAGITVLFVAIGVVFFRNRMRMRFRVDAEAADCAVIDRRASAANKVAIVAGVLGGKANLAGAGLLAETNKEQRIVWNAVAKVRYYKAWKAIALANSWRTLVTLYCTAENYDTVAAAVAAAIEARPAAAKLAKKSPLPRLLAHTALIVLAAIPLFLLPDLEQAAVLPALLTMAFALTALWLIPIFGWAVFAGLAWLAVLEVAALNAVHTSMIDGAQFSGWDVIGGDDEAGFVFAGLGAAYLVWLCIGLMRGKIRSGFADDMIEAGGK